MNGRPLEERLFDALHRLYAEPVAAGPIAEDVRLAISTALTLARREGVYRTLSLLNAPDVHLNPAGAFPLPARTVRKLREEPDPEGGSLTFFFDTEVMHREGDGEGRSLVDRPRAGTPGRVALWYDLMQNRWSEEQVPVDPAEVLP